MRICSLQVFPFCQTSSLSYTLFTERNQILFYFIASFFVFFVFYSRCHRFYQLKTSFWNKTEIHLEANKLCLVLQPQTPLRLLSLCATSPIWDSLWGVSVGIELGLLCGCVLFLIGNILSYIKLHLWAAILTFLTTKSMTGLSIFRYGRVSVLCLHKAILQYYTQRLLLNSQIDLFLSHSSTVDWLSLFLYCAQFPHFKYCLTELSNGVKTLR